MSRKATVRVAANFERNLEEIERFLDTAGESAAFAALLDLFFDTIAPHLERFPALGSDLLSRRPASVEGEAGIADLRKQLPDGASLREYIAGNYIVLYLWNGGSVHLLALKHPRQLPFDLRAHWTR